MPSGLNDPSLFEIRVANANANANVVVVLYKAEVLLVNVTLIKA